MRKVLMSGAAAAAISMALAAGAMAATPTDVNGGGAAAPAPDYQHELSVFNTGSKAYHFTSFYGVTSGAAQAAVLNDDYTQFGSQVPQEIVHYGASEQPLSPTQISSWATSSTGQSAAGDLIQLPSFGTGLAIITVNPSIAANAKVVLTDAQLCQVFSGAVTNWSQITTAVPANPLRIVYRSDSAGTTFTLTQHLGVVCNSGNSAAGITFSATTTFSTLFPSGVPGNFFGVKGLANLAVDLNTVETSAISYISPDYTTIDPNSDAILLSGGSSKLYVAALTGAGTKAFLPTVANIALGLTHPGLGAINTVPPANPIQAQNTNLWLPRIPQVTDGYPLVAYSNLLMPQCFMNPKVAAGLQAWLSAHYTGTADLAIETNNGLVRIQHTGAARFLGTVVNNILANKNGWNVNIQNSTACSAVVGR